MRSQKRLSVKKAGIVHEGYFETLNSGFLRQTEFVVIDNYKAGSGRCQGSSATAHRS